METSIYLVSHSKRAPHLSYSVVTIRQLSVLKLQCSASEHTKKNVKQLLLYYSNVYFLLLPVHSINFNCISFQSYLHIVDIHTYLHFPKYYYNFSESCTREICIPCVSEIYCEVRKTKCFISCNRALLALKSEYSVKFWDNQI